MNYLNKKVVSVVVLAIIMAIFSTQIFAYAGQKDLGGGWSITFEGGGSFSLYDDNRGICYATINITSMSYDQFKLVVHASGDLIERVVEKTTIKQVLKRVLYFMGGAAGGAANFIYQVMEPEPAY
jgi:hypothetical protein